MTDSLSATLSDVEMDLILFVERFHASVGESPTDVQINQRFNLDPETFEAFKQNPLVHKSFAIRGIQYPSAKDVFTPEQMHAAAVMTDLVDRRSDSKKLADLGITTRQWSTWVQDDAFATYLKDRSEKLLENSTHELHKGMMKGVRNGNVAAVKLAYEVTGRYRSNEESSIDVRQILHTFIEVIQRYVKDPVVMHNIAMDLSSAASAESLTTGLSNQMLNNAQEYRNRTIAGSAVPTIQAPPAIEGLD